MTARSRRAALGALVSLLLALLAPVAPTDRATTGLRLTGIEQCAPPVGRVTPRSAEQLPAAAQLPHATTAVGVALGSPTGSSGRTTRADVTTYEVRDAPCVRGPPGG
jgi:hypothetical protein